jgi:hypothetical protein
MQMAGSWRRVALSGGTAVVPVTEKARPEIGRGGRFSVTIDNILSKRRSAFDLDGNGAISVAELYR